MSARYHRLSDGLRLAVVGAALLAAAGSSTSNQRSSQATTPAQQEFASPAPRAMEADRAIGLWKSSFGPVKIETDPNGGDRGVQGAWRYSRGGREVIGLFWGALRGNVLDFQWHEPGVGTDLTGKGYLVFDPNGNRFSGKWWTDRQDRFGDWNGWRDAPAGGQPPAQYDFSGDDQVDSADYPGSSAPPPPDDSVEPPAMPADPESMEPY